MKRSVKIFLLGFFTILILVFTYYFNKPGRNVANETSISVDATELFKDFSSDETIANSKYLDKAIKVSGVVGEISKNQQGQTIVVLQTLDPLFGVACTLKKNNISQLETGTKISLKGICSGFTSDVVLRDCILSD
jgi:hypothetical protein